MKKIYAIFAVFMFLGFASTVFAAAPVVNLHAADNITETSATLSVTTTSSSTVSYIFEYGTDASFGVSTMLPTSSTSVNLTGLTANTTYYFRVQASNNDGSTVAPVNSAGSPSYYSFKTLNYKSTLVDTLGADNVTTTSATLNGRINNYGVSGTYYFRYFAGSTCASYLGNTSTQNISGSNSNQYVTASLTGLSAGQTYCAQLVGTFSGTEYPDSKISFVTKASGYNPNPTTYTCSITSFAADSTSVTSGSSTTIRWSTSNCTSANLNTLGGSVNLTGSQSTGALYSTTSYTLNAYGGTNGNDSKTISIGVLPNNGGTPTTYPSCYYAGTCYWNGSYWATINNGCTTNCGGTPTTYPSCYYSATCYWNGSSWVNNTNTTNQYPSCYYDSTCYESNGNWYYKSNGTVVPYTYNPHSPITNNTQYITKRLADTVKTIYVDQPVTTNPTTQYQYVDNTSMYSTYPVSYNAYNADDIMNRYGTAFYDYSRGNVVNGSLLTGSAGSVYGISLIELLLVLIVIALIVYLVKSNQDKNNH